MADTVEKVRNSEVLEFSPNHADILDRIWTSVQIDWETPTETRRLSRRSLASKFQIAAYDLDFLMASLIRDFFNNIRQQTTFVQA